MNNGASNTEPCEPQTNNLTSAAPRRNFVGRLLALIGGVVIWKTSDSDSIFGAPIRRHFESQQASYPKPTYIPQGFAEVTTISGQRPNRFDGFGDNPNDVVYWYQTRYHERGPSNPLCVYVSRNPLKQLAGIEEHAATQMNIPKGPNLTLSGEYYDGLWMPSPNGERVLPSGTRLKWDRSNVHTIIFRFGGYTFAVRGSRVVGVDLNELIRIAGSIE